MSEFGTGMETTDAEVLDFSGDGFKPVEKTWEIVRAEVVDVEGGRQLEIDLDDSEGYVFTEKFIIEHENVEGKNWAKAVEIARGNAKKLAVAATGTPTLNLASLVGTKLLATISEDKAGWKRISRYKPAPAEAPTGL